jgi:hypothetical protein
MTIGGHDPKHAHSWLSRMRSSTVALYCIAAQSTKTVSFLYVKSWGWNTKRTPPFFLFDPFIAISLLSPPFPTPLYYQPLFSLGFYPLVDPSHPPTPACPPAPISPFWPIYSHFPAILTITHFFILLTIVLSRFLPPGWPIPSLYPCLSHCPHFAFLTYL